MPEKRERNIGRRKMRKPYCDKEDTNKGAWSKQEDQKLIDYIQTHGEGCWRSLPKAAALAKTSKSLIGVALAKTSKSKSRTQTANTLLLGQTPAGLHRCGKSCRLRWINYLKPDIKRGNFAQDEEDLIIKLHALLGNRWSLIAGRLPGRTDNEIKNYWNSHIRRKLMKMGIDPENHKLIHLHHPSSSAAAATSMEKKPNSNNLNLDLTIAFDPSLTPNPNSAESSHKNNNITSKEMDHHQSQSAPTLPLFN